MLTINNTFSRRKRYRIYLRLLRYSFTSCVPCVPVFDVPASPHPRVPYLMSPSPKSPHMRPHVPVPLSPSHFYTQPVNILIIRPPTFGRYFTDTWLTLLDFRIYLCIMHTFFHQKLVSKFKGVHYTENPLFHEQVLKKLSNAILNKTFRCNQ